MSLHKKIPKILLCFFTKHYISKILMCSHKNHLNPSNYKTCLYNLFVCLYTKNTKVPPVFFHKTLHFKNPHVFSQNTFFTNILSFVCLYTKIPKSSCVFSQNTTFQKSSCVLTKHLNPSNYKTCLYNLFVYLYTKNTKDPPVFFHKTLFHKHPVIYPSK